MSIKNSDKDKFNLWDGLSITFIVQRYFSIFPLKRQGNEIVHSFFATIYSIFSAICYFSLLALALYVMYTEQMTKSVRTARRQSDENFSKSYLIVVIAVFELIFNNVGIIVMIAFSHLKKNCHMLFLRKLYDIDLIIVNELKMDINYRQLRVKCYVAYTMIFTYYTFLMCYVFSKLNDFRHLTPGVGLLTLLYQFEQSATGIMTWSYISYVMLLYHRFVFIKQCQENVVKERDILLKSGIGYTENIPVLSTLLVTYKELCSCIDVLNDLSGSILILRIAHDFTLTTSQVYLISWIVMDNNGEDKFDMIRTICFWMFPNIVKMVLTTLLTEKTIDEVCFSECM